MMLEYDYSPTKKSVQQQQPTRTKRKRRRWCEPSTLTVMLSGGVLMAYSLSIMGVVLVIDGQWGDKGGLVRHLRVSPSADNAYYREEWVDDSIRRDHDHRAAGGNDDGEDPAMRHLPRVQWPVTLRNEVDRYEAIAHPVDASKWFVVPRFWSRPIHNGKLMSRQVAMRVGSCSVPDGADRNLYARGADCPLHQRTIFVMIASYRDYQCRETIESIYGRAAHPERIRVGVVDQVLDGVDNLCNDPVEPCDRNPHQALCKYAHLIDAITLDARLSVGPVPARHIGHRMYRGEYYYMQSDAHVTFVNNWEMSLIHELESTGNEMAVLSTYLSDFVHSIDEEGNAIREGRPIMCNSYWKESNGLHHVHHSTQPECSPAVFGTPQLHPWWSAGFSFSRGHFLVNVPYDYYQPMVFSGEEMSIAIRGFSVGYDFYTPEKSVCFHHYAESKQGHAKRDNVPTFWENSERYKGTGEAGMRRLLAIVHMGVAGPKPVTADSWNHAEEDLYGLGGVRTPEQLLRILGINAKTLEMEAHLCRFVRDGPMHKMLTPRLRPDGMGIDYSNFDYHWTDPDKHKIDPAEAEEDGEEKGEEEAREGGKGDGNGPKKDNTVAVAQ